MRNSKKFMTVAFFVVAIAAAFASKHKTTFTIYYYQSDSVTCSSENISGPMCAGGFHQCTDAGHPLFSGQGDGHTCTYPIMGKL